MKSIDLNCDMGELKDGQSSNFDDQIMPYISSANIACGFHSGDPVIIEKTILSAISHNVKIGAHPSYNDRANFGRMSHNFNPETLLPELRYQICAIKGMVESLGARLYHVKPHGALYNDMVHNEELAIQFIQLVKEIDPSLKIMALAHSRVVDICHQQGMTCISEAFADRRYQQLDQLRSRKLDGAVLHDPKDVLAQIEYFTKGKVILHSGDIESIKVDSICLHSDTEGAVALSRLIHNFFIEKKISIG